VSKCRLEEVFIEEVWKSGESIIVCCVDSKIQENLAKLLVRKLGKVSGGHGNGCVW